MREKIVVAILYSVFFPDNSKTLQLRGRRQIAEPCKYCLVHVIVFFGVCFFYFLFLTGWEFGSNSLQLVSEPRVRFEWEKW